MPNDYGGGVNPVKPVPYKPPKPPVLTPPMNPPNYTPTGSPYGTPTPGPWGGGYTPPVPTPPSAGAMGAMGAVGAGAVSGANIGALLGGNTPPATPASGGGGGGDTYNGWPIVDRSPGGNILVLENGVPTAYDPWGNKIPHLYAGAAGGDPNGGAGGGGGAPAVPTTPAVPTPPTGVPPTFYAPTTGSPYLQLGNLWGYMNDPQRAQLNDLLIKAGFKPTGALTTYGNSDYLRPAQFDQQDLMALTDNENIRQWLRFYLGDLGYGISYGLPAGYQPGSGLPTPPPSPQA